MMILTTTCQADGAQGLQDSRMPRRTEEGVAGEDGVRWLPKPRESHRKSLAMA